MAPRDPTQLQEENGFLINKVKPYLLTFVVITTLGLSIWAFVMVQNEVESWEESKDFEDSLEDEIKALGNKSEASILLLAREIKAFKISYLNKMNELKLSFESKIIKLNQDLINVQGDVSHVESDMKGLHRSLAKLKDTMADENSRVWAEFTRLEKEIKNLPKNGGGRKQFMEMSCVVLCIILTVANMAAVTA